MLFDVPPQLIDHHRLTWWPDIPSHAYQYTFENNPNWSRFYAPGSEILEYLNHVVDKYGARKYMKFQHEFKGARWCEDTGKWEVQLLRHTDGQVSVDANTHTVFPSKMTTD